MNQIDVKEWVIAGIAIAGLISTLTMGYTKLDERAASADLRAVEAKQKALEVRTEMNLRIDKLSDKLDLLIERGNSCRK